MQQGNERSAMAKTVEQRRTTGVMVKLRRAEREAVERVAEREQTSMSQVVRRAIVRDLKRRDKASAE